MKRLIYCSQATGDASPDELVTLLELARARNTREGLTGMLLYCSQSFLQVLEGDEDAVQEAYVRISADARHRNLRRLQVAEISARAFPDWAMGFEHVDEDELARNLDGFAPETDRPLVNPDLITNGGVALTLLRSYAQNRVG